jgi:hypothetical protein
MVDSRYPVYLGIDGIAGNGIVSQYGKEKEIWLFSLKIALFA